MTAREGEHIDNCSHSNPITAYPTVFYGVSNAIEETETPLTITGFLPKGTVVDLYVQEECEGTLAVCADGNTLYTENIPQHNYYEISPLLSNYYTFRTSEKKIRVILPEDTNELVYTFVNYGCLYWCGMELTLPEEYAVNQWYNATQYDVYLGLEKETGTMLRKTNKVQIGIDYGAESHTITIHDDLSWTTEDMLYSSNRDTIEAWCKAIADFDGNCIVRYEGGSFSNPRWEDLKEYYTDILSLYNEYGFSWWSNDYYYLTVPEIVFQSPIEHNLYGYESFNLELLELLQKYSQQ